MKRKVAQEWLDAGIASDEEVKKSFADLATVARRFGGVSTLVSLLKQVAGNTSQRTLKILDVGAGPGAVAQMARPRLSRLGINAEFTLLDRSRLHLDGSSSSSIVADARTLPFRDNSFDVVACSTFAHHLEPEELIDFVNRSLRTARTAVVINDICRHPVHLGLVYVGLPLFRSHVSWHDGVVSVRRAYTTEELRDILSHTNAAAVEMSRHYLFRMGAIAWKR
jgi:ubiquinone/menaquinone biosynthesis C-methylase UbiE